MALSYNQIIIEAYYYRYIKHLLPYSFKLVPWEIKIIALPCLMFYMFTVTITQLVYCEDRFFFSSYYFNVLLLGICTKWINNSKKGLSIMDVIMKQWIVSSVGPFACLGIITFSFRTHFPCKRKTISQVPLLQMACTFLHYELPIS